MPPYIGGAIRLYRGENLQRWVAGSVGLCWTSKIEVAETFAEGLNGCRGGGVIVCADVPAKAIICAPSRHSERLGEFEYTVDSLMILRQIEVVRTTRAAEIGRLKR